MSTHNGYIGVVLELLEDLDTPKSLAAWILIRSGEWSQLADLQADPAHYLTASSYMLDAAASSILRKCKNLPGSKPKLLRDHAVSKWIEAEKLCCRTNLRFRNYRFGYYPAVDSRVVQYLHDAKSLIGQVLGPLPRDLIDVRHGKGATYHDVGRNCTVLHKMQSQPSCTKPVTDLFPLLEDSAWFRAMYNRDISAPKIVRGNRFTTVPKTIKGDRAIAVEPSINIWFQLGVGSYLRRRLRDKAMIDLDDGQITHRALARRASVDNTLATLDLSSASDTVSLELVRYLLPEDWCTLLESLRSPTTLVDGRVYVLEKFSSMGNGFTFELETLIFWALAQAIVRGCTYVYGDDIIIPRDKSEDVVAALRFCGFIPNPQKTFCSGPFRESCGGDFFEGVEVRPLFLKEPPNEPHQWISFANGLKLLSSRLGGTCDTLDHRVRRSYLRCLGYLPSSIRRLRGPNYLGDVCVHVENHNLWKTRLRNGCLEVMIYRPIAQKTSLRRFDPEVQLAALLLGVPSTGAIARDSVSGFKQTWVPLLSLESEVRKPSRRLLNLLGCPT